MIESVTFFTDLAPRLRTIILIFNPLGGDMKDEKNRITPAKNHLIDQKGLSFKNYRFDKLLWVQLLIFKQTAEKNSSCMRYREK